MSGRQLMDISQRAASLDYGRSHRAMERNIVTTAKGEGKSVISFSPDIQEDFSPGPVATGARSERYLLRSRYRIW
jgi:hypothetical protein